MQSGGRPNSGIQPDKISRHRTQTTRRFQCQKDLLTSRQPNFSNSYTINEKLEALIHLTDEEIRKEDVARRSFILSVLALSSLILLLVLGIFSVAKASDKPIEPRIWQNNPFEKGKN